ncbi:thiol:disulfide interchange protein DsbA/DsbL [Aquisalimonas asiatica]|uniref:Thiol:disulfide interchange protein n=1 Tax=Aquisalimonas asiatica TaxID=406100 RepID=A0A1H8UAC9_9GAMM|nr:thiol:disulfide interchange protein DsbA/DsbL [Aquisalimonas asiatica]SEP00161.1 thiol:disulfide interchange protein DsbA [Aquisalimonas asiatica]
MTVIRALLAGLLLAPALVMGQSFEAGNHYQELDEPVSTDVEDGKVEVREFFSYACPHCHTFNPLIQSLMADLDDKAELVHTAVVFNRSWEPLARAYYTSRALGVTDDTHNAVFNALHQDNRRIGGVDDVAEVMGEQGVDEDAVRDAWDSFSVDSAMRQGDRIASTYGVRSTPTVAVAGKYLVDVRDAGGQERMIEIIRYLVEKEYEQAQ